MNLRNILSSGVVILLFLVTVALYFGRGVFGCTADWWLDTTKALPVILLSITTWFAGGYKALPLYFYQLVVILPVNMGHFYGR